MACRPGDARADHQHARRRDGSGRGHQHGKHAGQGIGGDQHGLVAGDGGHGRERVHALRARDARHQLHGQEVHAAVGQLRARRRSAVSGSPNPIDGLPARASAPGRARRSPDWRPDRAPAGSRRRDAKISSRPAIRTPLAAYSESGKPGAHAGSRFQHQLRARLIQARESAPGTIATRRSPGADSARSRRRFPSSLPVCSWRTSAQPDQRRMPERPLSG